MTTVVAGSLGALAAWWDLPPAADVVALTTAAAFTGATGALAELRDALGGRAVEGLPAPDAAAARDPGLAERVAMADVVVLVDGSPLHARTVWRVAPLRGALAGASLVAVGGVASVLGPVMIDPRGGAPTVGLGLREGPALTVPATAAQLARTRALLRPPRALVVVGPRGLLDERDGRWRVVVAQDVEVTRGLVPARLDATP